jgi:hypothetical protein
MRSEAQTPARWQRALVAILFAGLVAAYGRPAPSAPGAQPRYTDFAQVWIGARELIAGRDPYVAVGPGRPLEWHTALVYPAPALVAVAPLSALPLVFAERLFVALSVGLLAYALTARGLWAVLWCVSPPVLMASRVVQWAPLLTAAALLPPLAGLAVVKPTIGLVPVAYRPTWWPVVGALALGAISFALLPDWPARWMAALQERTTQTAAQPAVATMYAPLVTQAGGVLALLALARWRRPEARALVVLACVPQTLLPYELAPLGLVALSMGEMVLLTGLACAARLALDIAIAQAGAEADWATVFGASGAISVWGVLLPAAVLILRRPNVGHVPSWVEASLARWRVPAWLRGSPVPEPTLDGT